jgi:hypothetical protein
MKEKRSAVHAKFRVAAVLDDFDDRLLRGFFRAPHA